jgi:DNA mismatch endonuclease (patch repair protein)
MALKPPPPPPASTAAVSAVMRGNKGSGPGPELLVRRLLHGLGYRFRTHIRELPGRPDLVFTRRRAVVQVHGCFWHQHPDEQCRLRSMPKSNSAYWSVKLARNVERDREQAAALNAAGWRVITVWECECTQPDLLAERLAALLGPPKLGVTLALSH